MIPRVLLNRGAWQAWAARPEPGLIGLWADTLEVHALFEGPRLLSVAVEHGSYPALSPVRPVAAGFECAVRDLWGHRAEGGDARPLLDRGHWPVIHPMSARPQPRTGQPPPPDVADVPDHHHVLLSGPIRPGLLEPAVVRVETDGRTVVAAQAQLGWAHKGIALLMRSKSPRAAARLAARIQADSTVAHAVAFARAAEDASGVAAPPRAAALRMLMLEVEALAVRCAGSGPVLDALRRASAAAWGHRMMMDCVAPGGVLADLDDARIAALRTALGTVPVDTRPVLDALDALPPGPVSVPLPAVSGEGLGHAPTPRGTVWHWVRLDNGTVANACACDPAHHAWQAWASGLAGSPLPASGFPAGGPDLLVSGADL